MTGERDALRGGLRARRRAIAAPERLHAAERLAERLLALPFVPQSGFVAGYWAMDGEIALHVWQLRLPSSLTYCLPVLQTDRLCFAPWQPGAPLLANRFGIPEPDVAASALLEPDTMSLVVLPLVGFDVQGGRLGMGGGWYDRTFASRRRHSAPPWLVGAAFAAQQLDTLHAEPWDVALDAVCTEQDTFLPAAP
ncbi:MAG: 5-formyltetrahydrofolate cyclo-ligase [Gammaproteobacteria bacterium]|nr:5-formyltetrahydrofolate cyclo-ligase [Gammaproteobacteria bacterium]